MRLYRRPRSVVERGPGARRPSNAIGLWARRGGRGTAAGVWRDTLGSERIAAAGARGRTQDQDAQVERLARLDDDVRAHAAGASHARYRASGQEPVGIGGHVVQAEVP